MVKIGYTIFTDMLLDDPVASVLDDDGQPFVFSSRREAEVEIVQNLKDRLDEFLRGERDFEEAVFCDEFVVELKSSDL